MDPLSTSALFEQFLDQRRYLKNVTPSTIEWYETAFKALQKAHDTSTPALTKSSLQQFVVSLRQRGVKPVSCNTYIKALNAFCLWLRDEGHHTDRLAHGVGVDTTRDAGRHVALEDLRNVESRFLELLMSGDQVLDHEIEWRVAGLGLADLKHEMGSAPQLGDRDLVAGKDRSHPEAHVVIVRSSRVAHAHVNMPDP